MSSHPAPHFRCPWL